MSNDRAAAVILYCLRTTILAMLGIGMTGFFFGDVDIEPFIMTPNYNDGRRQWAGRWALAAFFFAGRPGRPWAAGRV